MLVDVDDRVAVGWRLGRRALHACTEERQT
jgi:hypothetical protein